MIAPARVAAYQILRAVSAGTADLPAAIDSTRDRLPDERDQALAAEIATGVQRWRAALDHLIVEFSRRPIDRLDPEVVDILRLTAYQLTHLTRVPASASVDDGVELTKRAGKRSAAGFVNAVLRAISRTRNHLPLPPRPDRASDRSAAVAYLSVTLSHPPWLVARWLDRLGFDRTEAWCRFNNHPAPLTLRANRLRLDPMEGAGHLGQSGFRAGVPRSNEHAGMDADFSALAVAVRDLHQRSLRRNNRPGLDRRPHPLHDRLFAGCRQTRPGFCGSGHCRPHSLGRRVGRHRLAPRSRVNTLK